MDTDHIDCQIVSHIYGLFFVLSFRQIVVVLHQIIYFLSLYGTAHQRLYLDQSCQMHLGHLANPKIGVINLIKATAGILLRQRIGQIHLLICATTLASTHLFNLIILYLIFNLIKLISRNI